MLSTTNSALNSKQDEVKQYEVSAATFYRFSSGCSRRMCVSCTVCQQPAGLSCLNSVNYIRDY